MNASMNGPRCDDVIAIVVTYNPDVPTLQALLAQLMQQVGRTVIVDNGSRPHPFEQLAFGPDARVEVHRLERNIGIAGAQNIGIDAARAAGAKFMLLSDQDSRPSADMVWQLRHAALNLMARGEHLAAVGPCYRDDRQNNPPPFIRVEGLRVKRQYADHPQALVKVDYVIASGCLIPISTIEAVGMMETDMFIDYVDIEWGLRAKSRGYQSYGCFAATMSHSLGDHPIPFLGKMYSVHSPLRHYYMARNAIWLYKQRYVPVNWRVVDGTKMLLRIGFYTLYAKPRHKHFLMMMRGVFDGLTSRLGALR